MLEKIAALSAWAGELPLKIWLLAAAALFVVLSLVTFAWHERELGEQKCEARVNAATTATEAQVRQETLALAPYLDKFNALDEALKNNAP
ncbi:MAG: hypothetical protein IJH04_05140, partial [Eggerthellaceae bacterium]|nr:hypothetical protein [Eggerthellaceae bacterium]